MSADQTVFIVEDDASVRDALALLLGLKGFRTQAFASAEDFLAVYRPEWGGCLLLDVKMPGMSGLDLQRTLGERDVPLPVIVVTAHGDVAMARQALRAGAVDFLEKPIDDQALLSSIALAMASDHKLRRDAEAAAGFEQRLSTLTGRERQVLERVIEGEHTREIAQALGLSPRTVEVYKARMMEKLQVKRLPDLMRLALGASRPAQRTT